MLIINADDFGRSEAETDSVVACHRARRISSTTAMVFMRDSERAARLADQLAIDVGLHLNLSQEFTANDVPSALRRSQAAVVGFLTASKYALLVYNPLLRRQFRDVVDAQIREFERLYRCQPSHIDGHQHQHLCSNVLIDRLIPARHKVRRSFSFFRGEKNRLNRGYRLLVDRALARQYVLTDFFFSLEQCLRTGSTRRVFDLAEKATVELMAHPTNPLEVAYLMSDDFLGHLRGITVGTHGSVN